MPVICTPEELLEGRTMASADTKPANADAWVDPIVAEVREVRDRLAAECGYDLDCILATLHKRSQAAVRLTADASKQQPSADDSEA